MNLRFNLISKSVLTTSKNVRVKWQAGPDDVFSVVWKMGFQY